MKNQNKKRYQKKNKLKKVRIFSNNLKKEKEKYKSKKYQKLYYSNKSKSSIINYLLLFFTIFIIILLFILLFRKYKKNKNKCKSKTKVGLCIICKRENLYIKEFVDYYRNLGYNHIFIYDNGDPGDETYDNVIKENINNGFVSLIDYRNEKNGQIFKAYEDCYEKNNKNYDWLSFFDIDEYLVLKPDNVCIQEFLDNERYKDCQNIKFNWLIYTDDDKLHYENKPVQERFLTPNYNCTWFNQHVKSSVRGNLSTNYWTKANTPHASDHECIACSSSGNQTDKGSPFINPPDYTNAILKHYRTKTVEEYCNKMKKGKPDRQIDYREMINWFFDTNKVTQEKIDIFKKEFNIEFHYKK